MRVGRTLAQLEEATGISSARLSEYERRRTKLSSEDLAKLAQALGVGVEELAAPDAETKTPADPPRNACKRLRLAHDPPITLAQLQEVTGIAQSHLSRYERTGTGISEEKLERLAKALGVTLRDLQFDPIKYENKETHSSTG
jgi:transcriptional regulator with XRE-family HTH domain